jgi:hypothetical protein
MKKFNASILLLLALFSISSCAVIGGIFKAGVWVGALIIIFIVVIIVLIISKSSKKS